MNRPFDCNQTCQFCVVRCPDRPEPERYSITTNQEGLQTWQETQTNYCKHRITWVNQRRTACQLNLDVGNCEKCLHRSPQEFQVTYSINF